MMTGRLLLLFLAALLLGGCSTSPAAKYVHPVAEAVSPSNIRYCSGYSCNMIHTIGLSGAEWAAIEALFAGEIENPAEERKRVSLAVGLYESFAAPKTGTENDRPESPILFNPRGQLDCIDEATNTSVFLHLLKNQGLIRHHVVSTPAQRGFIIGGWFHSTAVLLENETGAGYAIDSWFYEVGAPAEVVPLEIWRGGWKPGKKTKSPPTTSY